MDEVPSQSTHESASPLPISARARLHQITPLSKYLVTALFIAMPFLGGYVGYELGIQSIEDTSVVASSSVAVSEREQADTTDNSTTFTELVYLSEEVTVDLSPIASGGLRFNIAAIYSSEVENLFGYHVVLLPQVWGGRINLVDSDNQNDELLEIYNYDQNTDLETFIEEQELQRLSRESNEDSIEAERGHSDYLRSLLAEKGYQASALKFSDYCTLKSDTNSFGDTVYWLDYDSSKYGNIDIDWVYVCGVGNFLHFGDIIVANYAVPVDAMDAKVVPYNDIQFIE
jgi:hypothetical protein